jgi:hypothetical protein
MDLEAVPSVEAGMSDMRMAAAFAWYFYYGSTTQGRAHR